MAINSGALATIGRLNSFKVRLARGLAIKTTTACSFVYKGTKFDQRIHRKWELLQPYPELHGAPLGPLVALIFSSTPQESRLG